MPGPAPIARSAVNAVFGTLLLAAALTSAATTAHAEKYCQGWLLTELRCLFTEPGEFKAHFKRSPGSVSVLPPDPYAANTAQVTMWKSVCGQPGTKIAVVEARDSYSAPIDPGGKGNCIEVFLNNCKPQGCFNWRVESR